MDSTNPKDRIGQQKPGFDCIPPVALLHQGQAHKNGGDKYGPMNWRETEVRASVYYNAILRHLFAWWDGDDFANDSEIHHLGHLIAGANILLDAMAHDALIDDRPTPGTFAGMAEAMRAEGPGLTSTSESLGAFEPGMVWTDPGEQRAAWDEVLRASESAEGDTMNPLRRACREARGAWERAKQPESDLDESEKEAIHAWLQAEVRRESGTGFVDILDPRTFVDPSIDLDGLHSAVGHFITEDETRNLSVYENWLRSDDLGPVISAYDQVQRTTLAFLIDNQLLGLGLNDREVRQIVSSVIGGEQG